ncbi:sulfatase [Pasteurellaceae bacterium Pebbles2]|nr:sulfatase [Pasteurellaceae bacterium Pebbles2]
MIKKFITKDVRLNPAYQTQLKRLRFLGLRFDAKYIAIGLSIPFLIGSLLSLIDNLSLQAWTWSIYTFIFSFLFVGIIIGNYFYFKTYNNYYDIFMFGLAEDDTKAVLKNIYEDYPVVKTLLFVFIAALLPSIFIYSTLVEQYFIYFSNKLVISTLLFFTVIVIALLARGTIRSLPLGKAHAQVSTLGILNKMVPNGIVAMEWAFKDRKLEINFNPVDLNEGIELMQTALEKNSLLDKTDENAYLEDNPPNVIFTLMESLGNNCLILDDPKTNDLLGKLRYFYDNSFTFKRFLAVSSGTAPTLAHIFFNSPIQNISQSIAQQHKLAHTPFSTYKSKGYKTIFITSGNIMWRNLGNYLPLQGVDEIYDQNNIIDTFPQAQESMSYWGVADEFAFALAEKYLLESKVPVFISILTITNHPPYQVPKHYQANTLSPSRLLKKFGKNNEEREKSLKTFQYASNALGQFMQNISQSAVGNNTILAAAGDHQVRGFNENLPEEYFLANSVPFILHIPNELQNKLHIEYDKNIVGSHKDIMPTLYSLSLSNTEYWNLGGRNLLTKNNHKAYNFAYNERVWADNTGVVSHSENTVKYLWKNDFLVSNMDIVSTEKKNKLEAYQKLLYWQINYQVKGLKH